MTRSILNRRVAMVAALSVLICSVLGCAAAPAAHEASTMNENREAVRAAFERWRAGTGGPFELLDDDARWTIVGSSPKSKVYPSKQEFINEVIAPFNARLTSPLIPTVRGLYADGDTVIVHFDGRAMASDGVPYLNTYSWHLRMNRGRIREATAFFDTRLFDEFWNRVAPRV